MSEYENVVGGTLRLKGKALGVKTDGLCKKKKTKKNQKQQGQPTGGNTASLLETVEDLKEGDKLDEPGQAAHHGDHLTPAEKRYLEQWEKIDLQRMAKMASKSHRDRIHEFNQYLANLTEHYDIPKVGPG